MAVCSRSPAQSGTPDFPVVHRTVSGAPGWTPVKRSLSGNVLWRTAIIHRTVRWCTRLFGEPTVASATVGHAIRGRRVARTNGQHEAPDSVRCTNCPRAATVVCVRKGRRSAPDGLPCLPPTAPSCLGAIKGTLRRMEELPKHSLSILRLQDSNFTHSILCDSDLSSI
jgi:hypothetical protein